MTIEEILADDDLIKFSKPDYTTAIVGVSYDDRVIYDFDLMVEWLMEHDGMDEEEAADFIDYNASFFYDPKQPIILYPVLE